MATKTNEEWVEDMKRQNFYRDVCLCKEAVEWLNTLLSSRDTYWKERIERVRRDLKARMAHEDYTKCETCEETLYHIDNLK